MSLLLFCSCFVVVLRHRSALIRVIDAHASEMKAGGVESGK
jgi:hypothetical protein